jgi:acyl-homoserine-lactone acylase
MAIAIALGILAAFAPPVQVFRDSWGVPSIVAQSSDGAFYGLGYMHVVDNAERVALNYKIARGRSGEVLGKGQLLQDGFLRGMEFEEKAEAAHLSPTAERVVQAYLRGANRALDDRRGSIPAWIKPFTRTDVLSMTQFVNCAFPLLDLASAILPGMGSNQFAVAPKRSATGHALLSMDPHLEWNGADGGILWYESGIYAPGITFRGVSIPGLPLAAMGHTAKVAWSMTNNDPTLVARYTVVTDPNDRNRYSYHGEWKEFRTRQIKLNYVEGGEIKESTQNLKLTEWGPMVPLRSEAAYLEPLGNFSGIDQGLAVLAAQNVADVRAALAKRGMSMWNFVYADTQGNIAYQYNAFLHRRDAALDWRKAVPGNSPDTKLGTLLSMDELPNVTNPASGMLVNANSSPWLTPVGPGIGDRWPAYITTYGKTSRYSLLTALLQKQPKVGPDEAREIATDTQIPYALATVKALVATGANNAGIEILRTWNGRADFDSVGAALFVIWAASDPAVAQLAHKAVRGEAWSEEDRRKAVDTFSAAEKAMVRDFGKLDIRWGELLRMRRGSREIGVSGFGNMAPGFDAAVNPSGMPRRGPITGEIVASRGSSWRMVVSLVPGHVQSWSVLPYGNSHDPKSPYYANQMSLFATRRYKATTFGEENVRRNAQETLTLEP